MNTELLANIDAVAHPKQITALGRIGDPKNIRDATSFRG